MQDRRHLINHARTQGLWLWCFYQDLWFSPDELEVENDKGKFLWGAVNWRLRDPKERIQQLEQKIEQAEDELTTFKRRVKGARDS